MNMNTLLEYALIAIIILFIGVYIIIKTYGTGFLSYNKTRTDSTKSIEMVIENGRKEYENMPKKIYVPYFKNTINIDKRGFQHIVDSKRNEGEIRERMMLIPYIPMLLESAYTCQNWSHYSNTKDDMWQFTGIIKDVSMTIIVREREGGDKHLYSVYLENYVPDKR